MVYSSSPPCDVVRIMLLVIVMKATVYLLEPLIQSSSPPLLLVAEPASHTPSSSTMTLHRMA